MNKYFLILAVCLAVNIINPVHSQTIPPYTITVGNLPVPGYFFLCPMKIAQGLGGIDTPMMIMDGNGDVVYIRTLPVGQVAFDFKMHENGLMSYAYLGQFFIMDSTFTVIDSVSCINGITTDTHDFQILPNGNYLMLGIEQIVTDLSPYHVFGFNNVPGSFNAIVESGVIQELDVNKNLVFEWHAWNYFAFTNIDEAWLNDPNQVDWTHCNAIDLDSDGNILLSSRHFNEITKIDHQTGSLIWRFGGNANQFNFLNDPYNFKRQHDVRRIANGNITLYDNGDGNYQFPFHFASGKEYQLNESSMTANMVWNYTDDSSDYSIAMGSFQRDPGGNSLVCYGWTPTNQNKVFSFVDNWGQELFEIAFDDTLNSYRASHYDTLPWDLNRPQITCYENAGQYYLDAGPGYASYLWSTGATTQVIPLTAIGTYHVFVPKGTDGFLKSSNLEVYNMADPCGLTGIQEHSDAGIVVSPNPVVDILELHFNQKNKVEFPVQIFNASGKLIHSGIPNNSTRYTVNTVGFSPGVYVVRYGAQVTKFMKF